MPTHMAILIEGSLLVSLAEPNGLSPLPEGKLSLVGHVPRSSWNSQILPYVREAACVVECNFTFSADSILLLRSKEHFYVMAREPDAAVVFGSLHSPGALLAGVNETFPIDSSSLAFRQSLLSLLESQYQQQQHITAASQTQLSRATPVHPVAASQPPTENERSELLRQNKERMKKYLLYEFTKYGVTPEKAADFAIYWKTAYNNCQFELRKEMPLVLLKREVLFNSVRRQVRSICEGRAK